MSDNNQNKWQEVTTPKATEPDAIERTVDEMAILYRNMIDTPYTRKTLHAMRNEFEEVLNLIDLLNDDQRADANATLRLTIGRNSLIEILRAILNVKHPKKKGN